MPVKWYGSLLLILLVGVVAIVYSRYEDQNPISGPAPAIGSHWYAAFALDVCGTVQPNLPTNPNSAANPGIHTDGDGVIRIEPTKAADAGNNATLSRFVTDYPKFGLTSTSLTVPGEAALKNGEKCPAKTPDAGKAGKVQIKVWPSATAPGVNNPTTTSNPSSVKLATGQLITVGFLPAGVNPPKPSAETITTMLQSISTAGSTTTTTTSPLIATTVPSSASTTVPSTATTATTVAPTTSTTKAGSVQPSK